MDRKTRKLLTMYGAHHPQADIDRLYLRRADGGRGLIGIKDCVRMEKESLLRYVEQSKEKLILAVGKGEKDKEGIQKEHAELRRSKPLHGQFEKATKEVCGRRSWDWLKKGHLKKETESTIVAAQDQAIRTNNIRKHIHKEDISSMCRMCGKFDETIAHIVAECPSLAQNEAGVPQGSILGPLFFLVYINDLIADLKCNVKLFADDTSLFTIVRESNVAANDMDHDLKLISQWAHDWRMSFIPDPQKQTVELIFSRKRNELDHPVIHFNKIPVEKVNDHKHLGILLDPKLSFSAHIKTAISKSRKGIGLLKCLSKYLPRSTLNELYKLHV